MGKTIIEFSGGKGSGGTARSPVEAPNTLKSVSKMKVIDVISEGEIVGLVDGQNSIKLDGIKLSSYSGYTVESREGLPDQTYINGFTSAETETHLASEVTQATPVIMSIIDMNIDAIQVHIQHPALVTVDTTTGDSNGSSVSLQIEYQIENGTWQNLQTYTKTGKCTSTYESHIRIEKPATATSQWGVRISRITPDSTITTTQNKTIVRGYTAQKDHKLTYPDTALVALTFDAQQFAGRIVSRQFEVRGIKVRTPDNYDSTTRVYSGLWTGAYTIQYSNNPAWILLDLLTSKYGLGDLITDAMVDVASLYEIAKYCDEYISDGFGGTEPRYTFNGVIHKAGSAYEVIKLVASSFQCNVFFANGLVSFTQDKPSEPVAMFNPSNVVGGDFVYTSTSERNVISRVIVKWNNPALDYKLDVEIAEDSNLRAQGFLHEQEVFAYGCTSRGQARRFGKWLLNAETETVTFKAGLENLSYLQIGSIIEVVDPTYLGSEMGGRVVESTIDSIEVDRLDSNIAVGQELTVDLGATIERKTISTIDTATNTITVNPAFSSTPLKGMVFGVRALGVDPFLFRVNTIKEDEPHILTITALLHNPNKYSNIEQGLAFNDLSFDTWRTGELLPPSNITTSEELYLKQNATVDSLLNISFDESTDSRTMGYEIQYTYKDNNYSTIQTLSNNFTQILETEKATYKIKIRGYSAGGLKSTWIEKDVDVLGLNKPPASPKRLDQYLIGNSIFLTWEPVTDLDLSHYEIRYSASLTNPDWGSAQIIKQPPKGEITTSCIANKGSYLIKAVDTLGIYSTDFAFTVNELGSLENINAIKTLQAHTTFPDTKINTEVVSASLQLEKATVTTYKSSGFYEFDVFDLGASDTVLLSSSLVVYGVNLNNKMIQWLVLSDLENLTNTKASDYDVFFEYSTSEDNITFTDYKRLNRQYFKARYFKFRLNITTNEEYISPSIVHASISIDMEDRIERGHNVTSPIAGVDVKYNLKYREAPALAINGQDMLAGDLIIRENETETGFRVKFVDSRGRDIERTFDWISVGYGASINI